MSRLIVGLKYLLNQDVAGRTLAVFRDDTFIVSYPKSGNTWVRFLAANLLHSEENVTLLSADRLIPSVEGRSRHFFRQMPRPRTIKAHYPFDPAYRRVLYVVRDPRDVALSQYYYQIKRRVLPEGSPIEKFVHRFVAGEVCPYGSWAENVSSWLAARWGRPDFLLIRYEDLISHPLPEVTKIANFLQVPDSFAALSRAIERSSAARMRSLERKEREHWASTKDTRSDISFIRSATSGGWRFALPQASAREIEHSALHLMRRLGYETSASSMQAGDDSAFAEELVQGT
jgi:hypothetical protein